MGDSLTHGSCCNRLLQPATTPFRGRGDRDDQDLRFDEDDFGDDGGDVGGGQGADGDDGHSFSRA